MKTTIAPRSIFRLAAPSAALTLAVTFALAVAPFSIARAGDNPNPWEEVAHDGDMRVWAREVPGSSVREIKAEMVVPVPPARLWAVIGDGSHYIEFIPNVVEGKVLGTGDTHYEYYKINPPMVSVRDYTLKITDTADVAAARYHRVWTIDNEKGPPQKDGCIRMTYYDGSWALSADGDKTKVDYWSVNDPGGSIPKWIVNKSTIGTVKDLLKAMKRRAVDPNYKR